MNISKHLLLCACLAWTLASIATASGPDDIPKETKSSSESSSSSDDISVKTGHDQRELPRSRGRVFSRDEIPSNSLRQAHRNVRTLVTPDQDATRQPRPSLVKQDRQNFKTKQVVRPGITQFEFDQPNLGQGEPLVFTPPSIQIQDAIETETKEKAKKEKPSQSSKRSTALPNVVQSSFSAPTQSLSTQDTKSTLPEFSSSSPSKSKEKPPKLKKKGFLGFFGGGGSKDKVEKKEKKDKQPASSDAIVRSTPKQRTRDSIFEKLSWFTDMVNSYAKSTKNFPAPDTQGCLNERGVYKSDLPLPSKIISIGDVHGDTFALADVLKFLGVANVELDQFGIPILAKWTVRVKRPMETVVVMHGDYIHRGPRGLCIYALLLYLREQARHAGSDLILLLGNHDVGMLSANKFFLTYQMADSDLLEHLRKGDGDILGVTDNELFKLQTHIPKRKEENQFLGRSIEFFSNKMDQVLDLIEVLYKRRMSLIYPSTSEMHQLTSVYPISADLTQLHSLFIAAQIGPYTFSHGTIGPAFAAMGVDGINHQRFSTWHELLLTRSEQRIEQQKTYPSVFLESKGVNGGVVWSRVAAPTENVFEATDFCRNALADVFSKIKSADERFKVRFLLDMVVD